MAENVYQGLEDTKNLASRRLPLAQPGERPFAQFLDSEAARRQRAQLASFYPTDPAQPQVAYRQRRALAEAKLARDFPDIDQEHKGSHVFKQHKNTEMLRFETTMQARVGSGWLPARKSSLLNRFVL